MRPTLASAALLACCVLAGCGDPAPSGSGGGGAGKDWKARLREATDEARVAAAKGIAQAKEKTIDVLPELVESMKGAGSEAAKSLAEAAATFGDQAVPVLTKALSDANEQVRLGAAWALERIGPPARAASAALEEAARSGSDAVRAAATRALGAVKGGKVETFVKGLGDKATEVRVAAAEALGKLGAEAKEAIPALEKGLEDAQAEVRKAAKAALEAIRGT